MTWSEDVALIFLQFLYDPELIRYLLLIAKPIHENYVFEEARLFHESLRMTREKRWAQTKELSKQRKFHEMNNRVPITCTLPFTNIEWRLSCELLKSIRYLRYGFLRRKYGVDGHAEDVDLELPLKIKSINLLSEDSIHGSEFRGYFGLKEIREALDDLEIYQEPDMFSEELPFNQLPYILIEVWCDGTCQSGYSKRKYKFKDDTDLYIHEIMN